MKIPAARIDTFIESINTTVEAWQLKSFFYWVVAWVFTGDKLKRNDSFIVTETAYSSEVTAVVTRITMEAESIPSPHDIEAE
jgi:hypothetical protein